MIAYELLPRLRHLTLTGQNDDGELEFVGTNQQMYHVCMEENTLNGTTSSVDAKWHG